MNGVGRATWMGPSGSTQNVVLRGDALPLENQQGSIIGLMDWSGNLVQRFEYTPFGETAYSSGPVPNYPYRFTGLEDDANGLYYVRNRYYSPKIGRFLSEDPIGFLGGSNMFAYVGNNPVTFADPLGLITIGEFEFDGETIGGGLATGAAAVASVFSGGLYDGGPFRCKPGFGTSVVLAQVGQASLDLAMTLSGAGVNACLWKGCFAPGTLVLMADGTVKPIEDVRSGDWILSKSDTTGAVEAKQVVDILERQVLETLALRLSNGLTIETTEEHPFWVEGKGWIAAGQLAIGNSIVTRTGPQGIGSVGNREQAVKVLYVAKKPGLKTVYNLDIDGSHSYFVGNEKQGWAWVHNVYLITSKMQTLNLSNQAWKSSKFGSTPLVYVLRDAKTGELLKVGKTHGSRFLKRFSEYVGAGKRTNRELELDVFEYQGKTWVGDLEKQIRDYLMKKQGHNLRWDHSRETGRVGKGTP